MKTLILSLVVTTLLTAGCGFQLRGEARLPVEMQRTHLAADPTSPFVRELAQRLRANGVQVLERPDEKAATLLVVGERMRRETLTLSASARVREFLLVFELDFELRDAQGEILIPREQLRMTRDYSFDELEILAATREEEFLRADLRQAMAGQLMRRLEAAGRR